MPLSTLRKAARESAAGGAVMVLRALSGEDLGGTVSRISEVIGKTGAQVWIDPLLFECFSVEAVPILEPYTNKQRKIRENEKPPPRFSGIRIIFRAGVRGRRECPWDFFETRKPYGKIHSRSQTHEAQHRARRNGYVFVWYSAKKTPFHVIGFPSFGNLPAGNNE